MPLLKRKPRIIDKENNKNIKFDPNFKAIKLFSLFYANQAVYLKNYWTFFYPKIGPPSIIVDRADYKIKLPFFLGTLERKKMNFLGTYRQIIQNTKGILERFTCKNFFISVAKNESFIVFDETADELSFKINHSIIKKLIRIKRAVGKCWLTIKNSPIKNQDFLAHYLTSCHDLITRDPYYKTNLKQQIRNRNMDKNFSNQYYDSQFRILIHNQSQYSEDKFYKSEKLAILDQIHGKANKFSNQLRFLKWRNRFIVYPKRQYNPSFIKNVYQVYPQVFYPRKIFFF